MATPNPSVSSMFIISFTNCFFFGVFSHVSPKNNLSHLKNSMGHVSLAGRPWPHHEGHHRNENTWCEGVFFFSAQQVPYLIGSYRSYPIYIPFVWLNPTIFGDLLTFLRWRAIFSPHGFSMFSPWRHLWTLLHWRCSTCQGRWGTKMSEGPRSDEESLSLWRTAEGSCSPRLTKNNENFPKCWFHVAREST